MKGEGVSEETRREKGRPPFHSNSVEKRQRGMNVLVPVTENDGELLVPSNVVGSRGLVVGMNDEGSSKTVNVLSCEREEGEEASSDRGEESGPS